MGMSSGRIGRINNPSMARRSSISSRTATSVLTNGRLDTSLTNALARSGVEVPGGDLSAACVGFRNLGGCVAALHVAKNLDLPGGFPALKDLTTGEDSLKLSKAIQELKPESDAKAEQKAAKQAARADLRALNRTQPRL